MKLLVVSNMYPSASAPSYGVFVKNFCEQLETLGIEYRLAVMQKGSSKLKKLFGYVGFYLKSFFCSLFGRYDAVYIHYASHSSPGVLLARKLRKFRIFTNCHGSDVIPENPGQEKMQKNTKAILFLSEKIIVPSVYFNEVVAEKYGISEKKLFVCASGGVDTQLFRVLPDRAVNKVFTMGFVGRISAGKGWDTLLKACAKLPDRDFRLVLVGDGPESAQMHRLLDELQLGDVVQRHGLLSQKELVRIYNDIDVFLFPTERKGESLGLVAIEAMACGTPVIASDYAAPACYVTNGENGYKFPMGDTGELAKAIQALRALPEEKRAALCAGALETAQHYTRQSVTRVLEKILLE